MPHMEQAEDHQRTAALYSDYQAATGRRTFQHLPLNHRRPSIRLIKIRPELSEPEGAISCEIRHATIDSTYTCLSYVWGGEDRGCWITLNNEYFWIRENLWQFLWEARRKPHILDEWLWIDALCIDQASDAERTHQVQQMGRIYSGAVRVISWLGISLNIYSYLAELSEHRWSWDVWDSFSLCEYWKRAWITQEIALARQVTFMARDVERDEEVVKRFRRDCGAKGNYPYHDTPAAKHLSRRYPLAQDKDLLDLLRTHKNKHCSILRDRIFSLLAICRNAPDLKVDYSIPDRELAKEVLRGCRTAVYFCAVNVVRQALQLDTHQDSDRNVDTTHKHPATFAFITLPITSFSGAITPLVAPCVEHQYIPNPSGHVSLSVDNCTNYTMHLTIPIGTTPGSTENRCINIKRLEDEMAVAVDSIRCAPSASPSELY